MNITKKILAVVLIVSILLTQSLNAVQHISFGDTKTSTGRKTPEVKISELNDIDLKQGKKNTDYELRGNNEIIVKYKDDSKIKPTSSNLKSSSVKFAASASSKSSSKKISKSKQKPLEYETNRVITEDNISVIEVKEGTDVDKVIAELKKDPNVAYVQPNYPLEILTEYSDEKFIHQWGLLNEGQEVQGKNPRSGVDINVLNAWNITKGSGDVVIGVLDTGIDITHPDLINNIYVNSDEIPGNGIDDDKNGYIDDVNGWDFAGDDAKVYDSPESDIHGTYVAGIIAATENNQGVVGVAPKVKVMPLKFINGSTGYTCDAIEAIEYAMANGVKVINCSFGGTDNNPALKDAMENSGILFISSAGNRGGDVKDLPVYPAAFDLSNIISVTSHDTLGVLPNFSNYGSSVDIAAPGTNVLSTTPDNGYDYFNGTSVSSAFVSGVVGLLMEQNKDIIISELKNRIINYARPCDALTSKVLSGGRLDAFGALTQTVSSKDDYNGPNAGDDTLLNNGEGEGDTWYTQDQLLRFKEKIHYGEGGVNPASGNFSFTVTDMSISSPGFKVNFSRTYNSRDEYQSLIGRGWTFGFEGRLIGVNQVEIKLPTGSTHRFTKDGSYYKPEDTRASYVKNADGTSVLKTQDQYSYVFNSSGYMTAMKDKDGNVLNISVDSSGKVLSVTDTVGRTYAIQYNASGLIDNIKDPLNRVIRYEYDSSKRLIKVVDPTGSVMNYGYDSSGFLTSVKDHYMNTIQELTYSHVAGDTQHKVISATDSNGAHWSYTYNMKEYKTTVTDKGGRKWTYFFDSSMYTDRVQDPEGMNEYTEYLSTNGQNVYGDVRLRKDKYDNVTLYDQDSSGNTVKIFYPDSTIETFAYDEKNNLIKKTNGIDVTTYYVYDESKANLLSETTVKRGVSYNPSTTSSSDYVRTTKTYYTKAEASSLFGCNVAGLMKSTKNPMGGTVTYSYDKNGNVASITDEEGRKTVFEYNAVGWKTAEILPNKKKTEYTYDMNGLLIKTKNADGGIIRVVYDKVGRKIREISSNDYKATSDVSADNYTGNEGTKFSYYPSGNLEKIIYPNGGMVTYIYDSYGNLIKETKVNGSVYRYVYDSLDRVKETYFKESENSSEVKIKSSNYGKRSSGEWQYSETVYLNEKDTATTTTVYDFKGRVVEVQYPNGAREIFEYNPDGTVSKSTAKNGATTIYGYDDFGRLKEVYEPMSIEKKGTVYSYTTYAYDKLGKTTEKSKGKELVAFSEIPSTFVKETFEYYQDGNVKKQCKGNQEITFTYDEIGNILTQTQKLNDASSQTTSYKYDYAGRKIEESYEVSLDALFLSEGYANGVIKTQYAYDLNGNLVQTIKPDGSVINYTYDVMNQPIKVSQEIKDNYGNLKQITSTKSYDLSGNVIATVDAEGNQTSFVYDNRNNLIKQIDAMGGTNFYSYDRAGRRTIAVLPEQYSEGKEINQLAHTAYTYDEMNQIIAVTHKFEKLNYNASTRTWECQWTEYIGKAYKYDNASRVIKELSGEGISTGAESRLHDKITSGVGTETTYNLAGLVDSIRDAATKKAGLNSTVSYTYDGLGRKILETNAKQNKLSYEYDDANNLISTKLNGTIQSKSTYDQIGRVIKTVDANGNTTEFRYNNMNKVSHVFYLGDSSIASKISTYQYDKLGNLTKEVTGILYDFTNLKINCQNDKTVLTEYNAQNNPVRTTIKDNKGTIVQVIEKSYDLNGNVLTLKDPSGRVTTNSYDKMNRLIASSIEIGGTKRTSSFTYDLNGNQLSVTNWLGNKQTSVYDALNRLVERIDANGVSTEKLEYNKNDAQIKSVDALNQVKVFKYDANGRKIETINEEGNSEIIDYDLSGNIIGKTDGLGNKTRYSYDAANRLKSVTNALGESTLYTYDGNGNLLSQTDGNGHTTVYEYNVRNKVKRTIQPSVSSNKENAISYSYDYDGNIIAVKDQLNRITNTQYDALGRIIKKEVVTNMGSSLSLNSNVNLAIEKTYDTNGNLLTMQDATGLTTWTYDETGRALSKSVTDMGISNFAYDFTTGLESGFVAEITTDPKGGITQKVYDKANRLVQVIDSGKTTSFDYYDNGNRKSVTYPDGSKEVYSYNQIGQNTTLMNLRADGTIIDQYSYTYDAAGNQTSKTDSKGTTTFVYDKLNRLSEVQEPSGLKTVYTYDKAGNRIREHKNSGEAVLQDTHYTYDANNRLTQTETRAFATDATVKTFYTYDAVGNMISQSKTTIQPAAIGGQAMFVLKKGIAYEDLVTVFTYDAFNQLKSSDNGVHKTTYGYNGFGLRTEKSVKTHGNDATTVTKYLYEGDKIILELDGFGNKLAKNVFGTNLLSREMAETKVYYMYNGHGDVTALLSETGDIVGSYYYDVWGNILEKTESEQITNPYRYAGYQYDQETDLYYLNARYYDAKIARFLTEDTVVGDRKDPLSLNRYSYCHNNPIYYIDPTGHWAQGDEKLNSEAQKKLRNLTYEWNKAKTKAEKDKIHKKAQSIRNDPSSKVKKETKVNKESKVNKEKNSNDVKKPSSNTSEKSLVKGTGKGKSFNGFSMVMVGVTNDTLIDVSKTSINFLNAFSDSFNRKFVQPYGDIIYRNQPVYITSDVGPNYVMMSKQECDLIAELSLGYLFGSLIEGGFKYFGKIIPKIEGGTATSRIFTSSDPLVGDLATAIDKAIPGKVVDVNRIIKDPSGRILTDLDIELDNIIIQVKSGGGKGLTTQLENTAKATGKTVIGYGPDIKSSVLKGAQQKGYEVFTNLDDLLKYIQSVK